MTVTWHSTANIATNLNTRWLYFLFVRNEFNASTVSRTTDMTQGGQEPALIRDHKGGLVPEPDRLAFVRHRPYRDKFAGQHSYCPTGVLPTVEDKQPSCGLLAVYRKESDDFRESGLATILSWFGALNSSRLARFSVVFFFLYQQSSVVSSTFKLHSRHLDQAIQRLHHYRRIPLL